MPRFGGGSAKTRFVLGGIEPGSFRGIPYLWKRPVPSLISIKVSGKDTPGP